MIQIGPDEHNPFGTDNTNFGMEQLVDLIAAAEKNWDNYVLNCASSRSLKNECFEVSDLDLNNKGYLGL